MKITAAVVPVRSTPFEIETLDLAAPAEEVLVRVEARGHVPHRCACLHTRLRGDDDS